MNTPNPQYLETGLGLEAFVSHAKCLSEILGFYLDKPQ